MFGKFQRRNNRKSRLSNWFADERDGDMQAFDLQLIASRIGAWVSGALRARALRRSARAEDKAPGVPPD